jgi:micrococcal nuclease
MRKLLALFLLFAVFVTAHAATLTGVVIVVIDGDTVLFKPDRFGDASRVFLKIRLADIDAPEKDQPYGDAATRALTALLLHQRVTLDTVATDSYGRTVARIQRGALQVNAELVRRGLAWAYTRYRRDAALLEAQREARSEQRGLWQDVAPMPPWVWRRESCHQRAPECGDGVGFEGGRGEVGVPAQQANSR